VRFLALTGVLFALLCLRRPDALGNPQFWAEDGVVFYAMQMVQPGIGNFFATYKAYLHLVPRLTMGVTALFPAAYAPAIANAAAIAITAFCCALFSLRRFRHLLASDALRLTVCLLLATALQSGELIGNITCVHFWLVLAALLAVAQPAAAYRGPGAWSAYALAAVALLAGLSDPAVVLLVPLAAGIVRRRPATWPAALAVTLASAAQAAVFLHAARAERGPGPQDSLGEIVGSSLSALVWRTMAVPVFGLVRVMSRPAGDFLPLLLVALLAAAVWLTALWWRHPDARPRLLATLYVSLASVVLVVAGRSMAEHFRPTGVTLWGGERYFLLGSALFVYLVALSLERWVPWPRARPLVLIALFTGGLAGNFQISPMTDFHWRQHAAEIDRWRQDRRAGRPTPAVAVEVAPGGPWQVRLPAVTK
jgi:hypothetical protein